MLFPKRKQKFLLQLFSKKSNSLITHSDEEDSPNYVTVTVSENTEAINFLLQFQPDFTTSINVNKIIDKDFLLDSINFSNDISNYLDNIKIDDHNKFRLLKR